MSQAKAQEFEGLLQAEGVKPHITRENTGGKDKDSEKVTDLKIIIVSWIDNYNQGYID
ncbi:BgTH12-01476 [Blumeria graminis f. sp. triticale]|uniref:BgTH12-01476 n=1 Tax=Blumeria graminis f. sp. triticale TaxID=1689686 RepID=A0A9W4CZI6_BLUGR|nr:BgTH12-01476 [Blumeria graminis f. sp. triticale]